MFVIRQAKLDDVGALVKLAKMVHFINLPADREIIAQKVLRSRECFLKAAGVEDHTIGSKRGPGGKGKDEGLPAIVSSTDFFMLVLEDTSTNVCVGTSQIIARMGGPGNPNFSMQLSKRDYFSKSLQTGTSQIVAKLYGDETGPAELGGLILQPAARGHKLGRFLSLVRFHLIGLHRELFPDRAIAEMMGPITADGQSLLWEYFGRRFIPLSYTEADKHCQRSREFISALLPSEDIYLSLLPPEARDVVGRVGEETIPARRLLEKLGFEYKNFVDPFDGGPHLEAQIDDLAIVKATRTAELGEAKGVPTVPAYVSLLNEDGEFRAVDTKITVDGAKRIGMDREQMKELGWDVGTKVGVTVMEEKPEPKKKKPAARGKKVAS